MMRRMLLLRAWAGAKLWTWILVLPVVAFLGFHIVRLVVQPSPTQPRAEELTDAKRLIVPAGAEDVREPLTDPTRIGGNGVIEPAHREIRVAAALAGRVDEVRVREGQWVSQGDILVLLDSVVEQAAIRTAQAEVESARAEMQRTVAGERAETRQALEAEARQVGSRAALSESNLRRTEALAESGAVPLEERDRARQQAAGDRAAADAADARLRASRAGARLEDRAVAHAALRAAEARLAEAEARLASRSVAAPEEGEILQVKIRVGEYYQPGTDPLVVLGDTRTVVARVDVDERDVGDLGVGARATVRVAAWPDQPIDGVVSEIGRRMGRKNVRTDDPVERNDVKILEVVVTLGASSGLRVGQRVVASIDRTAAPLPAAQPVADARTSGAPPG